MARDKEKGSEQSEKKLQLLAKEHDENIEKMIQKYENLIENKVKIIAEHYEKQLEQLQLTNAQYIDQIEKQAHEKLSKNNEDLKKNSDHYERVLEENRKLLNNTN